MGIEGDLYNCRFKDEVCAIISKVEKVLDQHPFSKNLWETPTLAYCFLNTIHSLLRSSLSVLQTKGYVASKVLSRSLVEHVLDLGLICSFDRQEINRLFAEYRTLLLYFGREYTDTYKDILPTVIRNYKEYVSRDFRDLLQYTDEDKKIIDWPKTDKKMQRYRRHWTGHILKDRVRAILVALYTGSKPLDSALSLWRQSNAKAESASQDWRSLSYIERLHLVMQELCNSEGVRYDPENKQHQWYLGLVPQTFALDSHFMHPTTYSVAPHLVPMTGTIHSLKASYGDDYFFDDEKFLYLCYSAAIEVSSPTLSPYYHGGRSLEKDFDRLSQQSPEISAWLSKL